MAALRGLLIAVEGIDGAGTTTQVRRLVEWLGSTGRAALATREPSDGILGALLRRVLRGEEPRLDPAAVALLFAADRIDHLERTVRPAIAAGTIVVSDRYVMSSLAYQSVDLPRPFVAAANARADPPALTLLVTVQPEVAAARRRARGGPDELFDALAFQERVAAAYLDEAARARAAGEPVAIVDGTPPPDEVLAALVRAIEETCLLPTPGAG
jgi:dTMP kinase